MVRPSATAFELRDDLSQLVRGWRLLLPAAIWAANGDFDTQLWAADQDPSARFDCVVRTLLCTHGSPQAPPQLFWRVQHAHEPAFDVRHADVVRHLNSAQRRVAKQISQVHACCESEDASSLSTLATDAVASDYRWLIKQMKPVWKRRRMSKREVIGVSCNVLDQSCDVLHRTGSSVDLGLKKLFRKAYSRYCAQQDGSVDGGQCSTERNTVGLEALSTNLGFSKITLQNWLHGNILDESRKVSLRIYEWISSYQAISSDVDVRDVVYRLVDSLERSASASSMQVTQEGKPRTDLRWAESDNHRLCQLILNHTTTEPI
eukprot:COSAG02_NODE_12876_length_1478_cov_1.666425_1_plen_317_part_10